MRRSGVSSGSPSHDGREDLVRSATWPDHTVPYQHVGAVLLLWNANSPRLLHDQAAVFPAAEGFAHLRRLRGRSLLYALARRDPSGTNAGETPPVHSQR